MTGTEKAGASIEDVLALARPRETSVRICVAGDLAAEAERLEAEIDALDRVGRTSLADGGQRAVLAARLDELIELMREAEVEFKFRGMESKAFSDLLVQHASQDPSKRFNTDTFPPALIAASCFSHPMTLEQSQRLHATLPEVSLNRLFNTAWDACCGETRVPTSRAASATTPDSAPR